MPKGVEHSNSMDRMDLSESVREPLMPKGVEHILHRYQRGMWTMM